MAAKAATNGLTRVVQVSPTLKKFLGVGESSRPDSLKRVWVYIKDQKLQNPQNRKEVFCDENLKPVLGGKDTVTFTEISKLLGEHFPKAVKVPRTPKEPKVPNIPKEPTSRKAKSPKAPKSPKAVKLPKAPIASPSI